MPEKIFNVLFLRTGNSARSIMAGRVVERSGKGGFRGLSAGSHPKGEVLPLALEILCRNNDPTDGLRSKDWSEFARQGASRIGIGRTTLSKEDAEAPAP